jgi:hypothetical protein
VGVSKKATLATAKPLSETWLLPSGEVADAAFGG